MAVFSVPVRASVPDLGVRCPIITLVRPREHVKEVVALHPE
jgi:hypothetical protein